ncbi:MAG: Fic family protein [Deltaproteobacteria bacterium]|nr:Fic family protein [Deltaproteobacteria bacterium]
MSKLLPLPPRTENGLVDLETIKVMKALAIAHRNLAELKGYAEVVPNKNILINALTLNESKDSSAIENIITTHDELFAAMASNKWLLGAPKEVLNYKEAIWHGVGLIKAKGFLSTNMIVEIQEIIEGNKAGIRRQGGTILMNEQTGEVVYRPPETESEIRDLMANLEQYMNDSDDEIDPLIKLAAIHYQFESIHPFYDGNGRTGRIINILYLVLNELLDTPILYLSKYILENRPDYYRLLQEVRTQKVWTDWIIYMLKGISEMSVYSLKQLKSINLLIEEITKAINEVLPKIYSKELVELIFSEFYNRISSVEKGLNVTRKTASNYLTQLATAGFLEVETKGREKVYINKRLIEIVKE